MLRLGRFSSADPLCGGVTVSVSLLLNEDSSISVSHTILFVKATALLN